MSLPKLLPRPSSAELKPGDVRPDDLVPAQHWRGNCRHSVTSGDTNAWAPYMCNICSIDEHIAHIRARQAWGLRLRQGYRWLQLSSLGSAGDSGLNGIIQERGTATGDRGYRIIRTAHAPRGVGKKTGTARPVFCYNYICGRASKAVTLTATPDMFGFCSRKWTTRPQKC